MTMKWKEQLRALEKAKDWDFAIALMEDVIKQNPNDMDAYIFLNFRLMDLLVEEYPYPPQNKVDHYEALAKKYFKESYAKCSNNLEYLYYTGTTAAMSEWFFDITDTERNKMLEKARTQNPEFPLVKFDYYFSVFQSDRNNQEALDYARLTLSTDSPVKKVLAPMGAIGDYLLDIDTNIAEKMLGLRQYYPRS